MDLLAPGFFSDRRGNGLRENMVSEAVETRDSGFDQDQALNGTASIEQQETLTDGNITVLMQ